MFSSIHGTCTAVEVDEDDEDEEEEEFTADLDEEREGWVLFAQNTPPLDTRPRAIEQNTLVAIKLQS